MRRSFLKPVLTRAGELLLSMALVGGFFLVFIVILELSFPAGTSLTDLVLRGADPEEDSAFLGVVLDADENVEGEAIVARLSRVLRSVKDKPGNAITWRAASTGSSLGDGHGVQTLSRSSATITFNDRNELFLQENSLVVIKDWRRVSARNKTRASLVVLGGELRGVISGGDTEHVGVEIKAHTSVATVRADAAPGTSTEFSVRVNPDNSSTVSAYGGVVEVESGDETVRVQPEHSVIISELGRVEMLGALPMPPDLLYPDDGATISYRALPPRISFSWASLSRPDLYRFVLARDPEFRDIIYHEETAATTFTHGNLREGTYYWQVIPSFRSAEGFASEPARLDIVKDREPPALRVAFPPPKVSEVAVIVEGSTEPGSQVFVRNSRLDVSAAGTFSHSLVLDPGVNVLVVEAVDAAGNVAYQSQIIHVQAGSTNP